MMETEMSSILNQSDISAPDDDLGNSWVEEMWNTFMSSNNENGSEVESEPASPSSEDEVFKDAIGDMEEVVQQRNEEKSDMESNEVPSSQLAELPSSSPSVCHQSAAPELEMSNLDSVPNLESDPTLDASKSTVGAIRSENSQEEVEETVQPNKSTCSASAEPEKKKSKVLVTRKITDYFKKLDRGKKENKEE